MAVSTRVKNAVQGTLSLADGTGTPVTLTVVVALGDFSVGPIKKTLNDTIVYERRGQYKGLGHGNRIYPQISFTAHFTETTNASAGALADYLLKKGGYSANISTGGSTDLKYLLDCTMTIEGTSLGDDADSTMVFNDVEFQIDNWNESMEGDTFAISGTVYGAITGLDAAEWA